MTNTAPRLVDHLDGDQGDIAARAVDVSKEYGVGDARVVALDHVTLDIPGGRFTAVMGPSGSGKTCRTRHRRRWGR